MRSTWKWRLKRLLAMGSIGGLCWALAIGLSPGQTTGSSNSANNSQPSTSNSSQNTTPSGSQTQDASRSSSNRSDADRTSDTQRSTERSNRDASNPSRPGQRQPGYDQAGRSQYRDERSGASTSRDSEGDSNRDGQRARSTTRDDQDSSRDERESRNRSDPYRNDRDSSRDSSRDSRYSDRSADTDQSNYSSQRDFSRTGDREQDSDRRDQYNDRQSQYGDRRDPSHERNEQYSDRQNQFRDTLRDDRQDAKGQSDQRNWRDDQRTTSRDESEARSTDRERTPIRRSADIGLWFDRGNRSALIISDLATSGPITRFGFREGDQILSVNGTRVTTESQFVNYLFSPQYQNQRIRVIVWRGGQQVPLWVEPWVLIQANSAAYAQSDTLEEFGIVLDDRYQQFPVVWKVLPQSPAYYAGLRNNDVIVAWNGRHVGHPNDLAALAQQTQAHEFPVQISRNRQLRQVTLEAPDGNEPRTSLRPNYDEGYGSYQPPDNVQSTTSAYSSAGRGTTTYSTSPGYYPPGTYVQPGPGGAPGTYVQPGTQPQQRGGILPRLRGR